MNRRIFAAASAVLAVALLGHAAPAMAEDYVTYFGADLTSTLTKSNKASSTHDLMGTAYIELDSPVLTVYGVMVNKDQSGTIDLVDLYGTSLSFTYVLEAVDSGFAGTWTLKGRKDPGGYIFIYPVAEGVHHVFMSGVLSGGESHKWVDGWGL